VNIQHKVTDNKAFGSKNNTTSLRLKADLNTKLRK